MCEFCEKDERLIETSLNMGVFGEMEIDVYLDTCGLLFLSMFLNEEYYRSHIKVNYCPMCGSKIENERG